MHAENDIRVECFFDCSSPWTYLAFRNLHALATEMKFRIVWRPILVGGVFDRVNTSVYRMREQRETPKWAYAEKDMQDWAAYCGVAIKFPASVYPVNSVKAMRGCLWLAPQGLLEPFAEAVFEAHWGRDLDIARDDVLLDICSDLGIEGEAFLNGITWPEIKEELRANTDELIARGGFGSPTIFVDSTDMYFGNDRLPLVRRAVLQRALAGSGRSRDFNQ